jgi:hypothetical protein
MAPRSLRIGRQCIFIRLAEAGKPKNESATVSESAKRPTEVNVRFAPKATYLLRGIEMTRRANLASTGRDVRDPRERFGREFDEPIALPNGRDASHDLGSAANAF